MLEEERRRLRLELVGLHIRMDDLRRESADLASRMGTDAKKARIACIFYQLCAACAYRKDLEERLRML